MDWVHWLSITERPLCMASTLRRRKALGLRIPRESWTRSRGYRSDPGLGMCETGMVLSLCEPDRIWGFAGDALSPRYGNHNLYMTLGTIFRDKNDAKRKSPLNIKRDYKYSQLTK